MDRIDYFFLLETRKSSTIMDFIEICGEDYVDSSMGIYESPFNQDDKTIEELLSYLETNSNTHFNLYWNNNNKDSYIIILMAMFTEDKHLILGINCYFNYRTIKKLKKMIQELNIKFEPKAFLFWGEDLPPEDSISFLNHAENPIITLENLSDFL